MADAEPQTPEGAALTDMILLVFRLNGRLLEAAEELAQVAGLTAARWQVLGGVLDEPRPVAEIARRMGLTRQAVQRIANVLVEDGFASWAPNPAHRRAKLLRPTPRARTAIRRIARYQHPWSNGVADAFDAAELAGASAFGERLLAELDAHDPVTSPLARGGG